jgi:putative nucleotidyltransferase with HDIG domain
VLARDTLTNLEFKMVRGITIISDGGFIAPDVARALGAFHSIRGFPVEASKEALKRDTMAIVVDVDMSAPETIDALRSSITSAHASSKRIFVVDGRRRASRIQALQLGADQVVLRPFTHKRLQDALKPRSDSFLEHLNEDERAAVIASHSAIHHVFASAKDNGGQVDAGRVNQETENLVDAFDGVGIDGWLATMRAHHDATYRHCLTVTGVAVAFGRRLGLRQTDMYRLTRGALMHDIGKAQIPIGILDKPGKLTPAETDIVRRHPEFGGEILEASGAFDP